ncbi:MAG: type II toxin-antitoxin system HicB family antitoxin [Bdellovibrio sp.]
MQYHFKIHKESDGYWAECVELDGCFTQADTREELNKAMHEALNLHLSETPSSKTVFPLPEKQAGRNIVAVDVEPNIALALSVRQIRLNKRLNQTEMMKFLGISPLSNYQRLEDPKRANPEFKTLAAITSKLPELNVMEILKSGKTG